jgi:hypothetical protein
MAVTSLGCHLPLTQSVKKKPQSTIAVSVSMSPNSRRIFKAQKRLVQDAAFVEMLFLRQANCGKNLMAIYNRL